MPWSAVLGGTHPAATMTLLVLAAACWAGGAVLLTSLPLARKWWGWAVRHSPTTRLTGSVLSALGGLCLGAAVPDAGGRHHRVVAHLVRPPRRRPNG